MKYFGFAFSASMLPTGFVKLEKQDVSVEEVKEQLDSCEFCLNPSHSATVEAARDRFDLALIIPDKPPRIKLKEGDCLILMQVRGLPRRTGQSVYSQKEVMTAEFSFMEIFITLS